MMQTADNIQVSQGRSSALAAEAPLDPVAEMPRSSLVRFQSIRKTYDGSHAVIQDLNLEIGRGEFLTLLGPSGSGKTTTLMMLAGFEAPTAGKILLDGAEIHNIPAYRRDIGVVFQNYALFPHMSVAENLAYPLKARRQSAAEITERVERALDLVQMRAFALRKPALLSGGQQQRVALARAMVFEPKLILMDEPLGALDKRLREDMQLEIKRIHEKLGVTIVYVTHDQSEALTMSDRIAIFNGGRIEQIDTPAALYDSPKTRFVASFIGDSNLLEGIVVDAKAARIDIGDGTLVEARPGAGIAVNDKVVVLVRPEKLKLASAAKRLPNRLRARVRTRIYLGDHTQIHLETAGGQKLLVKQLNATHERMIETGEVCDVAWLPSDSIVLRA